MKFPTSALPVYETDLPSTKEKIKYRPFVMREEKVLLLALQETDPSRIATTVKQVVLNCIDNVKKESELTPTDYEFLFLKIRSKSSGEIVDVSANCVECEEKNYISINLDNIQVKEVKEYKPTIELGNQVWVKMKPVPFENIFKQIDFDDPTQILDSLTKCIDSLIIGDSVQKCSDMSKQEVEEFLEGMTKYQVEKLQDYFLHQPYIVYEDGFECSGCGKKNRIKLRGLKDFFI